MARKISKKRSRPMKQGTKTRARLRKTSKVPVLLADGSKPDLESRLGTLGEWDDANPLMKNYEEMGVLSNPNATKNDKMKCPLKPKKAREAAGEETYSDDDELRVVSGRERKTAGKGTPHMLTFDRSKLVGKLVEKYGDDVEAMKWDTKINVWQHSVGTLKKFIKSYNFWGPDKVTD
ncbi:hypothetical protein BSKO_04821 [Bryopsis sp. KO-2023]|nr:hypothetical protein BSKO_04821 [Bryopsis sp. KO-2023]